MSTESVDAYFARANIKHRRKSQNEYRFACPACGRQKAEINRLTWLWKCWHAECAATGNEYSLKMANGHQYALPAKEAGATLEDERRDALAAALARQVSKATDVERWHELLVSAPEAAACRAYLRGRGFTSQTVKDALLGWSAVFPGQKGERQRGARSVAAKAPAGPGWLVIPSFTRFKAVEREGVQVQVPDPDSCGLIKCRDLRPDAHPKYMRVAGGESLLYCPGGTPDTGQTLFVVGGELDALSVVQAGWRNVVSASNGEGNWSDLWTRQLEAVPDVVICYDSDEAGRLGAKLVATALGAHRCRTGQWPAPYKDANEALVAGELDVFTLQAAVRQAASPAMEGVHTVRGLREGYLARLANLGNLSGTPTGWADLDEILGGWRAAEVTLVTGDTGCGKTTITSQAALFQAGAFQGPRPKVQRKVLYAPLELGLYRQMDKWVRQIARTGVQALGAQALADTLTQVEGLPLWLFNEKPPIREEALRNTLVYAARVLGVEFVVIDHLNWMAREGEWEALVSMTKVLAEVALETGLHILLVAHPKGVQTAHKGTKDRDSTIVQANDIKGGSAIKQNVDNIISVWRPRTAKRDDVIDDKGFGTTGFVVLKCRSDYGEEGSFMARYDPEPALVLDQRPLFSGMAGTVAPTPTKNWQDTEADDEF